MGLERRTSQGKALELGVQGNLISLLHVTYTTPAFQETWQFILPVHMAPRDNTTERFEKLLNFRDVGEFIRSRHADAQLKKGLLYRSARLDETTQADREKLVNTFKIRTVIDLRSKTEHINAAKKHSETVSFAAQSAAIPVGNDFVATPLKVPGLDYAEINLNGKGFERALLWQMKYRSIAKLAFLMAAGYRTEGISVLGKEIMLPRGLIGLGIDTLEHSGPEVKEVFDVLADRTAYPILVHCTQGKDRTGITIILALMLCGIDLNSIDDDYRVSEPELESEKEERMVEIRSIGLDESFAQCPADFCERINGHLEQKYGGVRNYLASTGISETQQQAIRDILLEQGS